MKKILLVILSIAALGLSSCKKDSSNKPLSDSYWPTTSGNSWTYKDVSGTSTSSFTMKMTGATSTINNKTYYTMTGSKNGVSVTNYIYTGNHSYSLRGTSLNAGITLEIQLGNDAQQAGYTWTTQPTDDGMVEGIPAKTINKIVSVNDNKTMNGKTYANVIHTQVDLQYDLGTGFETVATYDFYLAKGIGLIESDTSADGTSIQSDTITGYTVN